MVSLLAAISPAVWSAVFYVNPSATGLNNGDSWADAFTNLQVAIDTVGAAGGGEIWVKSGVYTAQVSIGDTDSFEALDKDAVDMIGEERTLLYRSSANVASECHLTVMYLRGDLTKSPVPASFGETTNDDSFTERLTGLWSSGDEVLVFANHPSRIDGTSDQRISVDDLTSAANASVLDAMEIKGDEDVVKWDYVLAHLDDQAGDCGKIMYGVRSEDQHYLAHVDFRTNGAMMGRIPTEDQDPIYAGRRLAFKDMIRKGSFVSLPSNSKCGMPTYAFTSSGGSASRIQVSVRMENIGYATSASMRFYGCDYATGSTPGTLLATVPLTLSGDNTASYYLTTTGKSGGQPLTAQQKASIKYIRPVITWFVPGSRDAYLQPVRIRSNGDWSTRPSPYPASNPGETIYFNTHAHSTASDGDSTAFDMRAKYWANYGGLDPTKPRFTVITDHQTQTPFTIPIGSVVAMKPGIRLYGGFAGNETALGQRNWSTRQTILDGGHLARCVVADGSTWPLGSEITIDGLVLRDGNAPHNYGGGVYAAACTSTIRNCVFDGNDADSGGGLCATAMATVNLTDSTFTGNSSSRTDGGGALSCVLYAYVFMTRCTLSNNTAAYGGGLSARSSLLSARDCSITGNTAHGDGGGFYANDGAVLIDDCRIEDNTADNGAGIFTSAGASTITNCVVAGNHTSGTVGKGGGIHLEDASTEDLLAANTVSGNTAYQGGGLYLHGCYATIANNAIAYNGGGIYAVENHAALMNNDLYANGTDYFGTSPGQGDISTNPLFVNRTAGDYHLIGGSPCIDAGTADLPEPPEQDMDGQCRVWGSAPDIGADEYWPIAVSPRSLADGTPIGWSKAIVTAAFTGFFYVESDDRAYGIRVNRSNHGLTAGMRADVTGTLGTEDGGRCIQAQTAIHNGSGAVQPLLLANRSVGGGTWQYDPVTGAGQKGITGAGDVNNIGLLICTTGRVTYSCSTYFYLDDGSALDDGSGHLGIKVLPYGLAVPPSETYRRVTGISSCYRSGADLRRLIRATAISPD